MRSVHEREQVWEGHLEGGERRRCDLRSIFHGDSSSAIEGAWKQIGPNVWNQRTWNFFPQEDSKFFSFFCFLNRIGILNPQALLREETKEGKKLVPSFSRGKEKKKNEDHYLYTQNQRLTSSSLFIFFFPKKN